MTALRYKFAPAKALAALHLMVSERPGVDLHAALKACYFADKCHLNRYQRPIFGATYRAMRFGPVPLEIYEMAKGEALWLAEMGIDHMPWRLDGYRLHLQSNETVDLAELSESDKECLREGIEQSFGMGFTERTAATHGPDWQAANLGIMKYEDMLDETPDKPAIIADMQETSRYIRL